MDGIADPAKRLFAEGKERALQRLIKSVEMGTVDPDMLPLLSLINSLDAYYTTSSCSGRIQLASTLLPGEKTKMKVIAKWHRPIKAEELRKALAEAGDPDIWLAVQGPILHVACQNVRSALALVILARNAGFKHSGLQGARPSRAIVELMASDRMEAPLRLNGVEVYSGGLLDELVSRANSLLLRGKSRLVSLAEALVETINSPPGLLNP